jgi:hypothetical protein
LRIQDLGIGSRAASSLNSKSRHWKFLVLNEGEEYRQHGAESLRKEVGGRFVDGIAVGEEIAG